MTGSGGADWRWSDEDLLGPVQLSRANVVFAIVLMVVAAVVILLLRFGDAGAMFHAHPAPRSLPAPTADRIVYVLYPDFPEPLADEIRNAVAADYGIAGSILVVQDGLDPAAYDAGRGQYGAERAIQAMEVTAGSLWTERIVVVGLTSSDLYIESLTGTGRSPYDGTARRSCRWPACTAPSSWTAERRSCGRWSSARSASLPSTCRRRPTRAT